MMKKLRLNFSGNSILSKSKGQGIYLICMLSTSLSRSVAKTFSKGVIYKIVVPSPLIKYLMPVESITQVSGEHEVILPIGTRLIMKDVQTENQDTIVTLQMEPYSTANNIIQKFKTFFELLPKHLAQNAVNKTIGGGNDCELPISFVDENDSTFFTMLSTPTTFGDVPNLGMIQDHFGLLYGRLKILGYPVKNNYFDGIPRKEDKYYFNELKVLVKELDAPIPYVSYNVPESENDVGFISISELQNQIQARNQVRNIRKFSDPTYKQDKVMYAFYSNKTDYFKSIKQSHYDMYKLYNSLQNILKNIPSSETRERSIIENELQKVIIKKNKLQYNV